MSEQQTAPPPPDEIRTLRQWVVWKEQQRGDKTSKVPVRPVDSEPASTTNPDDWCSYDRAAEAFAADGDLSGVGFVLAEDGRLVGIDIDGCVDAAGTIDGKAQAVIDRIGSYAEFSPSGRGVHIIAASSKGLPEGCRKGNVEIYQRRRYFTWTGRKLPQSPNKIIDATDALAELHAELFPPAPSPAPKAVSTTSGRTPTVREVIDKIIGDAVRARLWSGDTSGHNNDASAADLAIVNHVVYYAGTDRKLIESVLNECPAHREKWERKDYLPRTIDKAMADQTKFFEWGVRVPLWEREAGDGELIVTCMKNVVVVPTKFLWRPKLAFKKMTMLAGEPGLGKSFVTMDVAARVSRGDPWPVGNGAKCEAGSVFILTAEDGVADTVAKRLSDSGADQEKVFHVEGVRRIYKKKSAATPFSLLDDIDKLEDAMQDCPDAKLVIIDPISLYLGNKVNSNDNFEVRQALSPLVSLAERRSVSVLCVTHLNKGQGSAISRLTGSGAFGAAPRVVLGVVRDRSDPARRLILPIKNNLANDRDGVAYRVVSEGDDEDGPAWIEWEPRPIRESIQDLMSNAEPKEKSASREAMDFLRDALADGPVRATEIEERAQREGIKKRTLDRAKAELGVESFRDDGRSWWRLANHDNTPSPSGNVGNVEAKSLRPQVVGSPCHTSGVARLPDCHSTLPLATLDQPQQQQQLTTYIAKSAGVSGVGDN